MPTSSHLAQPDRELVTERLLAAPRDRVFAAFVDPDRLVQWWGPRGFCNTFNECDPRPGGTWRLVMHGPDGANYPSESVFEELVRPERIVIRHVSGPRFELIVRLVDEEGQTRLTWCQRFETAAECAKVRHFAVDANEQNLDRLEAELARTG
jgi:uncharacterized protein YndB with AHSA1/START domain